MKSDLEYAKTCQEWKAKKASSCDKIQQLDGKKCQKINYLTPETAVLIKTWLEKSKFRKIRILLDSGSSGSIILEKFVHKLRMKNDTTTSWIMKGGNFQTSQKCNTTFILSEFFKISPLSGIYMLILLLVCINPCTMHYKGKKEKSLEEEIMS